jgi:predicted Zn-dependent protease
VPLSTFEHTWTRGGAWAIAVVPPHRLPVSPDETTVLEEVAVLEGAGQAVAAGTAYRAMLERWPDSLGAQMGLGNVLYADNDFRAAEATFRRASAAHPDEPAPWNNLAYALSRQHRDREAIAAARMAVSLAGDESDKYLDTLAEVSAR